MSDIAAFLTACYDEEAADIQRAFDTAEYRRFYTLSGEIKYMAAGEDQLRHRLADLDAKRAIVEDYLIVVANNAIEKATGGDELKAAASDLIAKTLRMVLLRLAAPYANRPGYKEDWKP